MQQIVDRPGRERRTGSQRAIPRREDLLAGTRTAPSAQRGVGGDERDGIVPLVRSRLEVSGRRLLEEDGPQPA